MRSLIVLCLLLPKMASAWGFLGHQTINHLAVFSVPKPLFGFYKTHIDYLTQHSTDADQRRYVSEHEACRHYLDVDFYEQALPLDTLPLSMDSAIQRYSSDTVMAHGIVLWHVNTVMHWLSKAFETRQVDAILKLSADLGHYVGDLHVPLHTSSNYNGQKTNQKGIHALWESRLTKLYLDSFELFVGQGQYLANVQPHVRQAFQASHCLVDSVLTIEKALRVELPEMSVYAWEQNGQSTQQVYSEQFCKAYHTRLNGMVEQRLKASILLLADLWYTAWVNAGQPDLSNLKLKADSEPASNHSGKMLGRSED